MQPLAATPAIASGSTSRHDIDGSPQNPAHHQKAKAMRKIIFLTILASLLYWQGLVAQNQASNPTGGQYEIVLLQPTGNTVDSLPEMRIIADSAALYQDAMSLIQRSFMGEVAELYYLAQYYLQNKGEREVIEPAYLALTKNQSGYAKKGFHLIRDGEGISKPEAYYVDIIEGSMTSPADRLMSVTQLFPHEMGHVIYRQLSFDDSLQEESNTVDMHFFSIITDYGTAFNEGFSEHIENIARFYEPDDSIKQGIFDDIKRAEEKYPPYIQGFRKDFQQSWRLGYYKASMLVWYQRFEDFKRYDHAVNAKARFKNTTPALRDVEDMLVFRNSGVQHDERAVKNLVQQLATEGTVDAFFTALTRSELGQHYLPDTFYQAFMPQHAVLTDTPQLLFAPWQNQFLKYFRVMHEFMTFQRTERAHLIDFIEGYLQLFPSEREAVLQIFKETTGLDYTNQLPPQIWLLVKNHDHRLLVLDAFGAITIPVYTFDLNAAEVADFMTVQSVSREDAMAITQYRNDHGFFKKLEDIVKISGVSEQAKSAVLECRFDDAYFKALPEPSLSINALITTPLTSIFGKSMLYFLALMAFAYALFLRRENWTWKRLFSFFLKNLGWWLLLVIGGLIAVVLSPKGWLYFLPLPLLVMGMMALLYRKNKKRLWRIVVVNGLMGLAVFFSLV